MSEHKPTCFRIVQQEGAKREVWLCCVMPLGHEGRCDPSIVRPDGTRVVLVTAPAESIGVDLWSRTPR